MACVCWLAARMNVLTRWSPRTASSVGPCRLASAGVLVFVSLRWTFLRVSPARSRSSGPGRGAVSVTRGTLSGRRLVRTRVLVPALQALGDRLHPAQLREARAAHHEAAGEGEPHP